MADWVTSDHCLGKGHCAACRGDEGFRQALFAAGMVAERDFACPHGAGAVARRGGAGTELKRMLGRFGIVATRCQCAARAAQMDRLGPDWCEQNIETILGWLRDEARARGLPFVPMGARMLILRAIRLARIAEKQT